MCDVSKAKVRHFKENVLLHVKHPLEVVLTLAHGKLTHQRLQHLYCHLLTKLLLFYYIFNHAVHASAAEKY